MKTTKDVLTPEQHTTYITRITLADDLDPELKKMFRGKALETRSTRVGNLAISGTDPLATRVIRDAIGRPEGIGSGGGLLLNELEPFVAGPGFFGRYNIGSFFELARGDDPRLMPMSPALIETLKAGAGNVRFALRADGANATADVAIPLAMLEAIAKYPPVFDADATNENVAGEPPPPDPEEVDRTADEADPLILGREITPPELIKRAEPDYPESAKAEGVQGRVILQLVVEKSGAVSNVKILKSNDERLAAAATEAVRQWGYKPALRNGEPVRVYVTVTVNFKLRKD
jgi:TonB family protein